MNKTNNNVNTALAIVLIALAIMFVGGLGATTTDLTSLQKAFAESQRPDRFAGQDRCVSSIDESGSSSTCFYGLMIGKW